MIRSIFQAAAAVQFLVLSALAQSSTTSSAGACPTVLKPSYNSPVVGAGWVAQLIVTGLSSPRSIIFDKNGALLVVQSGSGIQHVTFNDSGGTCLTVKNSRTLLSFSDVREHVCTTPKHRSPY